mmetsp:Transcript_3735/g.8904  ORF Transcript_3735/g.8904 Transcript_3735/m.8904 type:complete len:97 (-) Transcript_3735:1616-1906(-)
MFRGQIEKVVQHSATCLRFGLTVWSEVRRLVHFQKPNSFTILFYQKIKTIQFKGLPLGIFGFGVPSGGRKNRGRGSLHSGNYAVAPNVQTKRLLTV